MTRRTPAPFFPIPPREYSQAYFQRVIQDFATYITRMDNPGEGRATTTVLTDVPTSTSNVEVGTVYEQATNLRIKSGTASENTSGLPVPQFTSATLPAVEEGTIIYDSIPSGSYSKGLRVSDGVAWKYLPMPYETGSYDATITPATSGSVTLTTGSRALGYVRMGRLVHVQGQLAVDSISSPSGDVRISLPYLSASITDNGERLAGSVMLQGINYGLDRTPHITINGPNLSYCQILMPQSNTSWSTLNANTLSIGDDFRIGFSYITDEDT